MKTHLKAWIKALRLFSFTIAAISCLLGITIAYADGKFNLLNALLVLICGALLQAGVNLVNDFFECKQDKMNPEAVRRNFYGQQWSMLEWGIYFSGLLCFLAVAPLGLLLVYRTGLPLFWIGFIGFIGGYFYTGEPFNYKRRGYAFVIVFFLMGMLMIAGSYYAVAATLTLQTVLVSIPVSALVSLLLLSNELRDFEQDTVNKVRTLTVRIGYQNSVRLYWGTVIFTYTSSVLLFLTGFIPHFFFIPWSALALIRPAKFLHSPKSERRPLTPLTARFHWVFGICLILTFLIP